MEPVTKGAQLGALTPKRARDSRRYSLIYTGKRPFTHIIFVHSSFENDGRYTHRPDGAAPLPRCGTAHSDPCDTGTTWARGAWQTEDLRFACFPHSELPFGVKPTAWIGPYGTFSGKCRRIRTKSGVGCSAIAESIGLVL